jgi:leucyl aminopeptidase
MERMMKFTVNAAALENVTSDALVVIHRDGFMLGHSDNVALTGHIKAWKRAVEKKESRAEWFCTMPPDSGVKTRHVLFESETFGAWMPGSERLKAAAARAVALCRKHSLSRVAFAVQCDGAAEIAATLLEGAALGDFKDTRFKSAADSRAALELQFVVRSGDVAEVKRAVQDRAHVVVGTRLARELVNAPNNIMTPAEFAKEARRVARKSGLQCEVLDEKALEKQGYGLLLGVGRASEHPPRLIVLRHRPKRVKSKEHLALVGKGVMFDTGGYCIKPSASMHTMNCDMAGAAAVLGAMQAIAALKLPVRVTAIIPAAVNAIDGVATLPGAVLTSRKGLTVYVENTDAEGRLLLADAFTRAAEEKATVMVDIATLTGAAKAALGPGLSALFTDDEELAAQLLAAGDATGDFLWRLPVWREYAPALEHNVADMANRAPYSEGGAIHAANFLKAFVPAGVRWAHLDIAAVARTSRVPRYYGSDSPTGMGVRLFVEWARGSVKGEG